LQGQIKGLVTYEDFRHLIIDECGNVVMDKVKSSELGDSETVESDAKILFKTDFRKVL
jgi:hypothetical protein